MLLRDRAAIITGGGSGIGQGLAGRFANVITFLASDDAGPDETAVQAINISGGREMY